MSLAIGETLRQAARQGAQSATLERRDLAALYDMGRPARGADERLPRQAATQLVAQLFFAPLLAEMRKNPLKADFASGGRGEEVFGEQLDLRLADIVAGAASNRLTRQIERELTPGGPRAELDREPESGGQERRAESSAAWPILEALKRVFDASRADEAKWPAGETAEASGLNAGRPAPVAAA